MTREEIAKLELGNTKVSPQVARRLTFVFLALLVGTVVWQGLFDGGLPYAFRLAELVPAGGGLPTEASIQGFEDEIEERSILRKRLRRNVQRRLFRSGLGNEDVVVGRRWWLFYTPDVDYVTGPGFLEPRRLARLEREHRFGGRQPDPVRAIVAFRDALKERSVELVVLPVPVKPQLAHAKLPGGDHLTEDERLRNPSEFEFLSRLDEAGVRTVEVGSELLPDRVTGEPSYIRTDTHWNPAGMARVARTVADELVDAGLVERLEEGLYRTEPAKALALGDVSAMLDLGMMGSDWLATKVDIERVVDSAGEPWTPTPGTDVLLLGDSFTNIFSLGEMGFGDAAGLAEHLSLALGRPLDRIARNAGGAYAAREAFALELRRDPARFAETRVVVYEFAMRELAQGDWKLLELPDAGAGADRAQAIPVEKGRVEIHATITQITRPPDPGSVPYKDAVIALHLTDVTAPAEAPTELVVFAYGMRDRHWTALAKLDVGDAVVVDLVPWEDVEAELGGLNRIELDDPDFTLIDLPLYWMEEPR
jgi:alginate O-acetyltransferase complex protein AlgJ